MAVPTRTRCRAEYHVRRTIQFCRVAPAEEMRRSLSFSQLHGFCRRQCPAVPLSHATSYEFGCTNPWQQHLVKPPAASSSETRSESHVPPDSSLTSVPHSSPKPRVRSADLSSAERTSSESVANGTTAIPIGPRLSVDSGNDSSDNHPDVYEQVHRSAAATCHETPGADSCSRNTR